MNEELDDIENPDYRLYNYYREIVKLSNQALNNTTLVSVIFEDDENITNVKKCMQYYKEIIDSYSNKLEQLSGQEYHP